MLLYDIEVLSEYRRAGIGTKLINELKTILIKEDYKIIWIPTNRSNVTAVEFFDKMNCVQMNEDDVFYFLNLENIMNNSKSSIILP
ncbi:GNAT family N-acetyltransferase [bacterium]|nr:GNAT family N-acetyltransferase [bacterium]